MIVLEIRLVIAKFIKIEDIVKVVLVVNRYVARVEFGFSVRKVLMVFVGFFESFC